MSNELNRRDFVRNTALAAGLGGVMMAGNAQGALTAPPPPMPKWKPLEKVRVGYVGIGGMGTGHVNNLLKIEGCQITALCDIRPERCRKVKRMVTKAGFPEPAVYDKGDLDFVRMCETEDLDLVYTATPWRWHVPVLLAALKNGKHAVTEVPAAYTVEDCWAMVEMAEKTGLHCGMMENCCYDRFELLILNMVKKAMFGDLLHTECGYLHDLRGVKFGNGGEGLWRREHSKNRNGDLYPTHGLGPVAQCLDINRGNQFDYLVAMGSGSRGLQDYALKNFGADSDKGKEKYKLGDVVTTLIRTKNDQTIVLQHDTNLPRPYSRDILVQGTKGIAQKYPEELIHIEGVSAGHGFERAKKYYEEHDHPLHKHLKEESKGAGHGGMDFIEDYRLINALRKGIEPDMDVYDAAAWSVVGPLSEVSIADGSKPVQIPDFTRGMYKKPRELQVQRPETY